MVIHIITDGYVLPYLLDPDFEKHLPVIPAEVIKLMNIILLPSPLVNCKHKKVFINTFLYGIEFLRWVL